MSVAEIEAAIRSLAKDDLARFNQWYQEFLEQQWDEQIRRDAQAGDFLREEARREREAGTLRRFP
ncbi:MAG: hypothetical protein WDO13_11210 [Verrucomicrobiota bacterium]